MIVQLHDNQPLSLSEPITAAAIGTAVVWVVDNWDSVRGILDLFPYNPKAPGEAARIEAVKQRMINENLMPYRVGDPANGVNFQPTTGAANFRDLSLNDLKAYRRQIINYWLPAFSRPQMFNPSNPAQVPRRVISRWQLVIAAILADIEKNIKEREGARANGSGGNGSGSGASVENLILPAALVAAAFSL
jgi:hypothetical protein